MSLYVDATNIDLQESEQYFSKALNKNIETLGDKNADIQVTRFGANTQPYYFFLDGNENKLAEEGYGYDSDIKKFINHLDKVIDKYKRPPAASSATAEKLLTQDPRFSAEQLKTSESIE